MTKRFFLCIFTLATAMPLAAYDNVVTHPELTLFATQKSALYQDGTIMFSLGLAPANKQKFLYRARVDDNTWFTPNIAYDLSSLIGEGAYDEDAFPLSLNHFFDPVFNRPLTAPLPTRTSWEWATEANGQIALQDNSLADARNYLNDALTFNRGANPVENDIERGVAMEQMFLALGHAVHHIQDMAQPQHVRDDAHLDILPLFGLNPKYNPSRYEKYTKEQGTKLDGLAAGAGVLPLDTIQVDRDFWFNSSNSGIATYTNRNFVSQGKNFTMLNGQVVASPYTEPQPGVSADFSLGQLYAEVGETTPPDMRTVCGQSGVDCTMTMYSTAVSARASTYSIFDQDLRAKGVRTVYSLDGNVAGYESDRLFALNRFNFDDAHKNLIPMAVTYSAGLINHFFRGKLNVTRPAVGPYAVVDQSAGLGFRNVKMTVANATTGEALANGTFQAIANYHRNFCYKPDLSGEWTKNDAGQPVPPCANWRSDEAYISVATGDATGLGIGGSQEMTFSFDTPIPLDARDLIIQVYFRGKVGTEDNSFALGAVDVSEPTFIAIMNGTDAFELDGVAFAYPDDIVKNIGTYPYSVIDLNRNGVYDPGIDEDPFGGDIAYEFEINGEPVGTIDALHPGRFVRLAALVDARTNFNLTVSSFGNDFDDTDSFEIAAKTAQIDYSGPTPVNFVSVVDLLRSQTLQWDSVTYYHYFPKTGADLDLMPISKDPDALTPMPIVMEP